MIINHNLMAMNTHRQLSLNNLASQKSIEKLSSGFRINRAGDDAAGLAISEKMRAQIRGLNMASKNSQDAISLIQIAEGALNETHAILQRMRELAVQAANDTNVAVDRAEIQKEINQLTSEINRIGNTTEFNTMKLLNGTLTKQVASTEEVLNAGSRTVLYATGVSGDSKLMNALKQITVSNGDFSSAVDSAGDTIVIEKTSTGLTVKLDATATSGASFSAVDTVTADSNGNYVYNNHGVSFSISAADFSTISNGATITVNVTGTGTISTLNDWSSNASGQVTISSGITVAQTADNKNIRSVWVEATSSGITVKLLNSTDTSSATVIHEDYKLVTALGTTYSFSAHGISFDVKIGSTGGAISAIGNFSLTSLGTTTNVLSYNDNSLKFQVGANEKQAMVLEISDMRSLALGISSATAGSAFVSTKTVTNGTDNVEVEYALDVSTHTKAAGAITIINNAIEKVSAERSKLGAVQNRLEHTIKNLDTSAENLQAAESRIRDLDMAKEMMNFTRNNILQQAATAMLAQANQAPQTVLQLLR